MWRYIIHSVLSYSSPKERKTGDVRERAALETKLPCTKIIYTSTMLYNIRATVEAMTLPGFLQ